jgi:hypothetical protein
MKFLTFYGARMFITDFTNSPPLVPILNQNASSPQLPTLIPYDHF